MSKHPLQFPDWLYNALPYFYLCAGMLTMMLLRNGIAIFSGLTLISAAGAVGLLRYRYRRAFLHSAGQLHVPDLSDASVDAGRLIQISWRDAFDCGHPVIDAQHRRLFGISNELIHAVVSKKPKFDLECLLKELVDDIAEHFCTEEIVLAKTMNPLSREHQAHHRVLLAKARSLRDKYQDGKVVARELVAFIAYDVITEHILKEDIKWAACATPVAAQPMTTPVPAY